MLTWMWLTFFATWDARWRALIYGALFVVGLAAIGLLIHLWQGDLS
jgi:hypothetical protein